MGQGSASETPSSSSSSIKSSEDSNTSSNEDSDIDSKSGSEDSDIDFHSGNVCDWLCEECVGPLPGHENLALKKCQNPGGRCRNLVHHICAVNWGQKHGVKDAGNLCWKHTPGYFIKKTTTATSSLNKKPQMHRPS
jgi:hypothetical protein